LNCSKMSDGNMGGGPGANALFNINNVGFPSNMGLLAYIDKNAALTAYPSSNTQYSNDYTEFDSLNSSGNDIINASYSNATADQCQATCNSNTDCAGFVLSSSALGSTCYPKTSGISQSGSGESDPNYTTYVRTLEPINPGPGISSTVNNVTSVFYQNYPTRGENAQSYSLKNLNSAQQAKLDDLKSRLDNLTQQLSNYTTQFSSGLQSVESQSSTNTQSLGNYLTDLDKTNTKLKHFNGNVDNILNDSDIVILQKNYSYLFWSILAIGTVLVSMNLARGR